MEKIIYHGSDHIIRKPVKGMGKKYNDYGIGFYCTENLNLAKEWSVGEDHDGFANVYRLEMNGLDVLDLNSHEYCMLDWLSILIENRTFRADGDIAHDAISYIKTNFSVDYKNRDVIRGWRADDSYFSFALGFVSGTLSYRQLCHAMRLGNLGEQIVIKSEKAFHELEFVDAEEASRKIWLESKTCRDSEARAEFKASRKMRRQKGDIYITDIMDEEMKRDDPRLQ